MQPACVSDALSLRPGGPGNAFPEDKAQASLGQHEAHSASCALQQGGTYMLSSARNRVSRAGLTHCCPRGTGDPGRDLHTAVCEAQGIWGGTYTLLSVRDRVSASLDKLCCSLSLALVAGARA